MRLASVGEEDEIRDSIASFTKELREAVFRHNDLYMGTLGRTVTLILLINQEITTKTTPRTYSNGRHGDRPYLGTSPQQKRCHYGVRLAMERAKMEIRLESLVITIYGRCLSCQYHEERTRRTAWQV